MTTPSHLAVVALPFEVTTSFQKGTAHGPAAILHELETLDPFDLMLGRSPFEGVARTVIRPHAQDLTDARLQQAIAGRIVGEILDSGGFPFCLGGEHTVSVGPIRAALARGPIGVIQLDAHADLRNEYDGELFSHATTMRRVLDMGCPVMGLGVRTMCLEESQMLTSYKMQQVSGRQFRDSKDWHDLIETMPARIYLSVDMDVFDPADVPAVGTPEPGGPGWHEVCDFLFHLFASKDVVAADIVELMPGPGDASSVRLAARLLGLITGLRFS